MATYEIKLPKSFAPQWPDRCVTCPASPTTRVPLSRDSLGGLTLGTFSDIYTVMTGRTVEVPACDACAKKIRRQDLRRKIIFGAAVAVASVVAVWWMGLDGDGIVYYLAFFGIALLCLVPWIAWSVMFPAAVDITVTDQWITYEFTDREFAQEFVNLNGSARE